MKTKKELKAAYKQKASLAGVFQVKNKQSGMILLDQSLDVNAKWNRHRTELRFGSHRNKKLQSDWKALGEAAFEFSLLSALEIKEEEQLNPKEELQSLRQLIEEESGIQNAIQY